MWVILQHWYIKTASTTLDLCVVTRVLVLHLCTLKQEPAAVLRVLIPGSRNPGQFFNPEIPGLRSGFGIANTSCTAIFVFIVQKAYVVANNCQNYACVY